MTITFHPEPRMVLICNFDTGFQPPEMTKRRPVVVLSPRRHNAQTCIVVPLSSTPPVPPEAYHHLLEEASLPKELRHSPAWAKCNMIAAVALDRLDRVRDGRDDLGRRKYVAKCVSDADFAAIRAAVQVALGIGRP